MTGIKHDTGKPRMSLIPDGVLDEVLAVLEFGAKKYSPDNWHKLENAKTRYYDAAHRHIAADRRGEKTDEESGRHPLAHAIADLIFMLGLELRVEPEYAPRWKTAARRIIGEIYLGGPVRRVNEPFYGRVVMHDHHTGAVEVLWEDGHKTREQVSNLLPA